MQRPGPPLSPRARSSPPGDDEPCPDCSGSRFVSDVQPGSMTADVIKPQEKAFLLALRSATSRVESLECYALSVTKVAATYRDWDSAQQAAALNDEVLDIIAQTADDEHAVEDLSRQTDSVIAAEQAFRDSVHEAHLAAEALAFPDDEEA